MGTPFHIGTISGGTFNGTVTNEAAGRISGGTYNGSVYGTFYTVAFVSNGGTAVPNQKYANTPVTAPTVSRAGYTLVGWYTDEACTAAYDFTQPVTDSVTLYAKWEAAPRYYYNSGTTTDTDNADEDKKGSPKTFDPGAGHLRRERGAVADGNGMDRPETALSKKRKPLRAFFFCHILRCAYRRPRRPR